MENQSCIKGIVSSSGYYWKILETRFWQQQLKDSPTAQCAGNRKCPPVWVLLCYMRGPSTEEGGAWSLFKRSYAKISGRNIKSVLCSSKRFFRSSVLYVMKSALLEHKGSPCWSVSQGLEGSQTLGIGEWMEEQWTGRAARLLDQARPWLVGGPCPWLGYRGTNG